MARTEPVVIPFEGDPSDLLRDTKAIQGAMDKVSTSKFQQGFENAKMSVTDFRSGYMIALDALRIGEQIWNMTVTKTAEYAQQVRLLSNASGESATETSRLIQVMDDYGISAEQLTTSVRALTKEGKTLTIDVLAKMSDQYIKLSTQQQKNEYIIKNLGREGLRYAEILEKGGDALRKQADAVDESLILNEKQLESYRKLEIAWDALTDKGEGWGNMVSNVIVPAATMILEAFTTMGIAIQHGIETGDNFIESYAYAFEAVTSERDALLKLPPALEDVGDGMESAGESAEGFAQRLDATERRVSSLYKEISKGAFDIMKSNRDYTDSLNDLATNEADVAQKRKDIEFDLYQFRQEMEQKLAEADSAKEKQKLQEELASKQEDYYRQLQSNEQDMKELDEKRLEVDRQKIEADAQKKYNLLEQRALIDGVISSGENEWLLEQAEALGLITPAARDAALAQSQWADAMYASFAKTQPGMEETLRLMQEMAAFDGTTVNFGVAFTQSGTPGYAGSAGTGSRGTSSGSNSAQRAAEFMSNLLNNNPGWRDSGGAGIAGEPYMIGTGAQPEMFIPKTSGTFIPNADKKLGATYNIVINNPKREAAENSIRAALKRLSYTGVVQ